VCDIEVIVIDDGSEEPVWLPEPPHGELRLIRTEHRGVGAARALGLTTARGAFVAYCDDDDEWTPDHLAMLLAYLREHPDVALAYGDAAWTDAEPCLEDAVSYRGPWLGQATPIHATDVMHRANAARDVGGFDPSLQAYEDLDLWQRMAEVHVLYHVPVVVATHSLHAERVTACDHPQERERLERYYRRSLPSVQSRSAEVTRANFDPTTWQPDRRELVWQSMLDGVTSFGLVGRQLVLAAEQAGIDVMLTGPGRPTTFPQFARFFKPLDSAGRIGISYGYQPQLQPLAAARVIIYAVCETTLVPKARVNDINTNAVLLYVPCRQNVESFQASGVHVPIKILHHGVDPARFPYLVRLRTGVEPFTFGTFGTLSPRKGADVLIRAFRDEFTPHEPVRLLLKSRLPIDRLRGDDPRITVISGDFWSQAGLLEFLRQLDAFVLPSRGEGFGLCGLEAMATGLPVIATNWSGPVEYLDPADSFPLAYRLVDAAGTEAHGVRFFGQWAEPDYAHLRSLLRWIFEHPQEAMHMGQLASARVHRDWTWDRVAQQLRDDCDLLARDVTPW
jgi:glycosyltransferase involved in cell wall biosynthesis